MQPGTARYVLIRSAPIFLTLVLASCDRSPQRLPPAALQAEADLEAVMALVDDWDAALNASDVDASLALLADGAVLMPPGSPELSGKDAIRAWLEALHAQGAVNADNQVAGIQGIGDWLLGHGSYVMQVTPDAREAVGEAGKWLTVFRRQGDGTWKVTRSIWNRDEPSPRDGR